jgi:protein-disulfide isomerase
MKMRLEGIATGLIVAAAIAVATANLHREFARPARSSGRNSFTAPTYVKNWKEIVEAGTIIGDRNAPVKIIEFADLECPGCRLFYSRVRDLPASVRSKYALVFVHFPLRMHRFAMPAARAAECARAEDKFTSFVDVVFGKQDSLGLKPWAAYALEAGIRDTAAFARCAASSAPLPRVEAGLASGKSLSVTATPTIIVNGWRYSAPPFDSLAAVIARSSPRAE